MSSLDMQYIAALVPQAQSGDSNAFAELFAATYQKQYAFARSYLGDDFLAQEAIQETYIQSFRQMHKLRDPALVVVWLNQITLRTCFHVRDRYAAHSADPSGSRGHCENRLLVIDGREYSVRQIMTLPFSEAQTILLSYLCGMKAGAVASLLETKHNAVRRYMDHGRRRLRILSGAEGGGRP